MEETPGNVNANKLIDRDGLKYEVGSAEPFTGIAVTYYPSGQKGTEAHYCNGKHHGKIIFWWENGQKASESEYRDGKMISEKCWDEDGWTMGGEEQLDEIIRRIEAREG